MIKQRSGTVGRKNN